MAKTKLDLIKELTATKQLLNQVIDDTINMLYEDTKTRSLLSEEVCNLPIDTIVKHTKDILEPLKYEYPTILLVAEHLKNNEKLYAIKTIRSGNVSGLCEAKKLIETIMGNCLKK